MASFCSCVCMFSLDIVLLFNRLFNSLRCSSDSWVRVCIDSISSCIFRSSSRSLSTVAFLSITNCILVVSIDALDDEREQDPCQASFSMQLLSSLSLRLLLRMPSDWEFLVNLKLVPINRLFWDGDDELLTKDSILCGCLILWRYFLIAWESEMRLFWFCTWFGYLELK